MATLVPSSEDVRVYEVAVLYPFPVNQKEEQDLLKEIEGLFEEAGGKLLFKDSWGRRGLAYTVGGFTEGNFVIYYYELDPSKLKEIDRQMKILKGLLRHMIIKPPKNYHVSSYAEHYVKWQEEERIEGERVVREKEDKLKKQVIDRAVRKQKAAIPERKKDEPEKAPVAKEDITQQVDKLLSDTDISL